VWCWGSNTRGQLGRSPSTSPGAPLVVDKVAAATSVVAGTDFACARLAGDSTTGQISCWGWNYCGQLGDGKTDASPTPVLVGGLTNAVQVVASSSSSIASSCDPSATACARLADGKVACWGDNSMGVLGDPNYHPSWSTQPVYVAGLEGVAQIAAGSSFFCSIVGSVNGVKCWGYITSKWQSANAIPVGSLTNVTHLSAGTSHACALLYDGSVKCWGYNFFGQLGNGTIVDSATPVQAI